MTLLRGGVPAGQGAGYPGSVRKFDGWAASYDLSQLQAVLYGPVHDAVLRYARRHIPCPGEYGASRDLLSGMDKYCPGQVPAASVRSIRRA